VLADENVERATIEYLGKLGHDVERVGDVPELGLGADDESIVAYARQADRVILTQDDDFFTTIDPHETAGVLFQKEQTLTARTVGDIVHEMSQYIYQEDVTLEYVSENWL